MNEHIIEIAAWIYVLRSAHYVLFKATKAEYMPVLRAAGGIAFCAFLLFGGIVVYDHIRNNDRFAIMLYAMGGFMVIAGAIGALFYGAEALLKKWRNRNEPRDA